MDTSRPAVVLGFEEGWEIMEVGGISKLKRILEGKEASQFRSEEYMSLYTTVYNLSMQNEVYGYPAELYSRYNKVFVDYISSTVLPSLRHTPDGELMLKEFVKRWANHVVMVRWLSRFFQYLERYYVPRSGKAALKEASRLRFVELVYKVVRKRVADALVTFVNREREGEQIDRSLFKNVLDIFLEIGVQPGGDSMEYYVDGFEDAMLKDTAEYYSRKASDWIGNDSCPDYMSKAEGCLKREKERVAHYMHSSTEPKLLEQVRKQLLSVHENQLLEKEYSGCLAMLRNDKVDDLARMYRLFSNVQSQGLHLAAQTFKRHVTEVGMALVKEAEDAASDQTSGEIKREMAGLHEHNFIQKIIEQHDKFLAYVGVDGCFANDFLFHKALREAFEVFCNKSISGSCTADMLASFCDRILRKGGGPDKLSHEEIEETLEKVVKVLAYTSDKDLFGEFYRKKMARRLLFDTSASDEHERSIIARLKQKCGGQFTSKMEGMVTDMALAKEKQSTFEEYMDANSNVSTGGVDLTVTVLTTGFWPTYKSHDVNLPKEMVKCVEVFKEFYRTNTKHRKLSWLCSMGSCNLIGNFEKRPIELVVTTYQACVLMLFNSCDRLSCSEIVTQVNLGEDDVKRLLHSLSCAKYKVLNKEPNTKTISSSDVFEFNSTFTYKMRRIKIPLPPLDEKKKVIEDVNNDRRYTIDATIVRIMKSRKVLKHQQLVTECVEQLSSMFKPDFKVIKKRIDELVERDYLERDDQDPNTFKYVA